MFDLAQEKGASKAVLFWLLACKFAYDTDNVNGTFITRSNSNITWWLFFLPHWHCTRRNGTGTRRHGPGTVGMTRIDLGKASTWEFRMLIQQTTQRRWRISQHGEAMGENIHPLINFFHQHFENYCLCGKCNTCIQNGHVISKQIGPLMAHLQICGWKR